MNVPEPGGVSVRDRDLGISRFVPAPAKLNWPEQAARICRRLRTEMLAHPDLVKYWGSARPLPEGDLRRYYELAIDGIAESGIAVEVSTAGLRKPVRELYPHPDLLAACRRRGVPVTTGSDAHAPDLVGQDFDRARELLRSAGYETVTVFEQRRARQEPLG